MQYRNDVTMARVLDSELYRESQTITVKIPIAIPYMIDKPDFVRIDGNFEYQGIFYRMVKQKYERDTLTVICVQDFENARINQALSVYVKTFSDQANDQNQNSKMTISFIKDYLPQTFSLKTISSGWEADVVKDNICQILIPSFTSSVVHPPERA